MYLVITVLGPWLLLGAAELGLRAGGYGNDYPLFISYPDHPGYIGPNPQVAKRYFGDGPFVPTPQLDFFKAEKTPSTLRIVFQGESSALGYPYVHGGAPSRMLETRLQAALPGKNVELINTALTAVNSFTLLDFANEIIAQHPDAVMIYTGHNEYYGIFGAGSARGLSRNRITVRAYLTLRRFRLVQLVANVIAKARSGSSLASRASAPRTVMELMAGDQRIPFGSPRYQAGLDQFRYNIRELLSRYHTHGIPVFIGTLASNERDQPPFAGAEATALYSRARIEDARGNVESAAKLYRQARDRDELRFRAPEEVNDIIRIEAARNGATVVETERALEDASPGRIIGRNLILEHLHPNIDGYFLIANAFYEALVASGTVQVSGSLDADARSIVPVTEVDSLIGLFHADRLMSGWPFQPRGKERPPVVDTLTPKSVAEALAQSVVLGRMSWPEAMDKLRESYEKASDSDRAVHVALAMAEEYRYAAQPLIDASRIEIGRKNYDAALKYVLLAVDREETAKSVQLAGLLLLRKNQNARAIKYLERSVQLAPNEQKMAVPLRAATVIPSLETERARSPRDTTVLYTLAAAYALTQQYEKSHVVIAELRAVAPNHAGAKQLLTRLPPE